AKYNAFATQYGTSAPKAADDTALEAAMRSAPEPGETLVTDAGSPEKKPELASPSPEKGKTTDSGTAPTAASPRPSPEAQP
ncbi:MAG: hypothetical protein RLZZ136_818, partial [Pseudomonadota bacterium]